MSEKVALIVAGGSGIGADAARKLAESGYLVGVMSSSGKGERLGEELNGFGFTGSNLDPGDLEAFVSKAMQLAGRIDGIVNCSGHGPKGELTALSDEDWRLGMDYYFFRTKSLRDSPLVSRFAAVLSVLSNWSVQPSAFSPDR